MTLQGIAATAVALADAQGLAAVTMRSLATTVGVSAPGLYRYVVSRDELVDHMVDLVSAGLEHPPPSGDWVRDLVVVAEQQRALFRAHPWLAEAVASLRVMGPHVLDHFDWGLAVLADVPAPSSRKMEALALTNGIAALSATPSRPVGPETFTALDAGRHPRLAALLAAATPTPPSADLFHRVLEGLLRAVLTAPAPPAVTARVTVVGPPA
ncbi:TetR/AcrR family transcriptional regulator [Frankia sp. R82]|uniref:TetR/AcrR family transcriptional regulator n=1 Tax=Frankia sp. R82 TaxID=2950553 RepID=UPI0020448917|nr:helix-turn-helix domain-containing protein [Frankia sp. R82]MCM3886152.1 TetR/AcrR family transcriptional regulator [Frankia sp. R82]